MRVDGERGVLVCDHCGSQKEAAGLIERLELLGATSSTCPGCASPLSKARLGGHPLLCCPRCFGTLIEMNRFAAVIDALRIQLRPATVTLPPRPSPRREPIECPSCGQPMIDHVYGGPGNVAIDTCERCLVNWLDAGELRRIAAAPDTRR